MIQSVHRRETLWHNFRIIRRKMHIGRSLVSAAGESPIAVYTVEGTVPRLSFAPTAEGAELEEHASCEYGIGVDLNSGDKSAMSEYKMAN